MSYTVTCHDDPDTPDFDTEVGDPWPRDGYIQVLVGLEYHSYQPRDGGPPYHADYVDLDAFTDDELGTEFEEGAPGPEGPPGPAGPIGETGPEGPAGATPTYQGEWDIGTTYSVSDIVTYDGSSWISRTDANLGHEPGAPTSDVNWGLLSSSATGPPGEGVPAGGSTDQVLAKASATDYDTEWVDPAAGGGEVYQQLTEPVTSTVGAIWIVQAP